MSLAFSRAAVRQREAHSGERRAGQVGADGRRWFVPDASGGSYLARVSTQQYWIESIVRSTPQSGTATTLSYSAAATTAAPEAAGVLSLLALTACGFARRPGRDR